MVIMKYLIAMIAGAGMLSFLGAGPAAADRELPWCVTKDNGAFVDCSYFTLRQCVVTARGEGHCIRNGRFDWEYYLRGQAAPVDIDPNGPVPRRRHWR
jgi:hypothetical protein